MAQVIIFKNDNNGVSVIHPTPETLLTRTIFEIARKDVPPNKKFKIIDETELPDREFREAWTVSISDLNDGIGNLTNLWDN